MKLEAHWTWDGYIVGMGEKPEQDHHLTVLEGLEIPSRAQFQFPILEALPGTSSPSWRRVGSSCT